jgi:hypothetical protein
VENRKNGLAMATLSATAKPFCFWAYENQHYIFMRDFLFGITAKYLPCHRKKCGVCLFLSSKKCIFAVKISETEILKKYNGMPPLFKGKQYR